MEYHPPRNTWIEQAREYIPLVIADTQHINLFVLHIFIQISKQVVFRNHIIVYGQIRILLLEIFLDARKLDLIPCPLLDITVQIQEGNLKMIVPECGDKRIKSDEVTLVEIGDESHFPYLLEILLFRSLWNRIDKCGTPVNDLCGHTADQVHFLLSRTTRSHDDDQRIFRARILQDFLFRNTLPKQAGVFHVRQFTVLYLFLDSIGQPVQLIVYGIQNMLDTHLRLYRKSETLSGVLQTRHIDRTEIHMHQHHLGMYFRRKVKTELTGFHGIIREVHRNKNLVAVTLLLPFRGDFFRKPR